VKKVARDVRFDVMAGRTRCLNVTLEMKPGATREVRGG
jgi:hypothetical protein